MASREPWGFEMVPYFKRRLHSSCMCFELGWPSVQLWLMFWASVHPQLITRDFCDTLEAFPKASQMLALPPVCLVSGTGKCDKRGPKFSCWETCPSCQPWSPPGGEGPVPLCLKFEKDVAHGGCRCAL